MSHLTLRESDLKRLQELDGLSKLASWILENRFQEFLNAVIEGSRESSLGIMSLFSQMTDEQLQEFNRMIQLEALEAFAKKNLAALLEKSVQRWADRQLNLHFTEKSLADDLVQALYLRKRVMMRFASEYTTSPVHILELNDEFDTYLEIHLGIVNSSLFNRFRTDAEEQRLLIQKMEETFPGLIYVIDRVEQRILYIGGKAEQLTGYTERELKQFTREDFINLLHPDDLLDMVRHLDELRSGGEDITRHISFRIRRKDGAYHWIGCYESIYKKDGDEVSQTVGILFDDDEIMRKDRELEEHVSLYNRAEAITHIGSFKWKTGDNYIDSSDEFYRIFDIPLSEKPITPNKVNEIVDEGQLKLFRDQYSEGQALDHISVYLHITTRRGVAKILHVLAQQFPDPDTEKMILMGTVQDVTERQKLITKLQEDEKLYRQAEELAMLGNWRWNVQTNEINWTDNLYRIYGMEPQSEVITIKTFLSFIHPADRDFVARGVDRTFKDTRLDYTFRIVTRQGKVKIIRSISQLHKNDKGEPIMVMGTERDITEKQNLIDRLQQSEKLFKQAQHLARLGNWSLNTVTHDKIWSDEMFNIYEIDPQPVNLDLWKAFIHPEDKDAVMKEMDRVIETNGHYDRIHRIITGKGNMRVVHRKGEVHVNEEGEKIFSGTTQNITEEYATQQELSTHKNFLQKVTDSTPALIFNYHINTGEISFINRGIETILGYSMDDVRQHGLSALSAMVHPDDIAELVDNMQQGLKHPVTGTDLVLDQTYRMRLKNGLYHWFHTYSTIFERDDKGEPTQLLNITLDINDQVEASRTIKDQEHFIQQLADASPTILYLYDVEQQSIVYINREIFFVLGYLPNEILDRGADITDWLYHPDDIYLLPGRKQSQTSFKQVDSMIQYECRLKNRDGDWRWLLVREVVFKTDESGKITQVLGAALDINKRKEMEKTILQNSVLLEQSNASLEEFAYVASHDLKEPLRKISTFGDRLQASQKETLSREGQLYLDKIVDASQRMQTMISDLLSISMIRGNTDFEPYSLQTILSETLQTLEYKIEQMNAEVVSDELPMANIIPSQFRQLFQNLLSNSLKFFREDVRPVIRISYSRAQTVEIPHYPEPLTGDFHKLRFDDNGIGFENEFAGKIFAIFQRLHGRSEYEGSGIGLAICKKIVEHHGGIIYAEGQPDKGASFTIILPA